MRSEGLDHAAARMTTLLFGPG